MKHRPTHHSRNIRFCSIDRQFENFILPGVATPVQKKYEWKFV